MRSIVTQLMIYGEKEKKKKEVYLKLCKQAGTKNQINLEVVDEDGFELSTILAIDSSGLYLRSGINKNLGLSLDKNGRIKLDKY